MVSDYCWKVTWEQHFPPIYCLNPRLLSLYLLISKISSLSNLHCNHSGQHNTNNIPLFVRRAISNLCYGTTCTILIVTGIHTCAVWYINYLHTVSQKGAENIDVHCFGKNLFRTLLPRVLSISAVDVNTENILKYLIMALMSVVTPS